MEATDKIAGFFGEFRWLSNFYPVSIMILGIPYQSVEAAYQASKTTDIKMRKRFSNLNPKAAKSMGRNIPLRTAWDDVLKIECMELCLRAKFLIPEMRTLLVTTGDLDLVERNDWGDVFWGECRGKGRNVLGKLLMGIRDELIAYKPQPMFTRKSSNHEIPF